MRQALVAFIGITTFAASAAGQTMLPPVGGVASPADAMIFWAPLSDRGDALLECGDPSPLLECGD